MVGKHFIMTVIETTQGAFGAVILAGYLKDDLLKQGLYAHVPSVSQGGKVGRKIWKQI